jgi:hypothetical protein
MNEKKAPGLSSHMHRKTEVSESLQAKRNSMMDKTRKHLEAIDDAAHGKCIQIHIKTNPI